MAHSSGLSVPSALGLSVPPRRRRFESLRYQLESERTSFVSHWRELADFILPRRPRFLVSDANRGNRRSSKIQDGAATLAARSLSAGMMGGITSPARPWFRLTVPDMDLAEIASVKVWLEVVTRRMRTVFLQSNLYNSLSVLYKDLAVFAISPMVMEEDFDDTVRSQVVPVGAYMVSANSRGVIDTFLREYRMTVRQVVERFAMTAEREAEGVTSPDWSRVSRQVKEFWDRGLTETWIDVCHVIAPNPERDPRRMESRFKRYLSCTYEKGFSSAGSVNYLGSDEADLCMGLSGFDRFPVLCPRWEVTGEDAYGSDCPGMTALGDIKQLQLGERRGMQAIEKHLNPPMTGPYALRTSRASILPGDITYLDVREGMQGFRPAHEVQPQIRDLEFKQEQKRDFIARAFHMDLFLMLAASDKRERRTAREIQELHEEKLILLGPVLERLNTELLDPLIDFVFDTMLQQGQIPPPPPELEGQRLRVEYVSIMAQAQKFVGLSGMERFLNFIISSAEVSGGAVIDKVDWDEMVDEYADISGVPPAVVVPDEAAQAVRAQRAQAQAVQAASQMVREGSAAANDLSKADTEKESLLKRLMEAAGAGEAAGGEGA